MSKGVAALVVTLLLGGAGCTRAPTDVGTGASACAPGLRPAGAAVQLALLPYAPPLPTARVRVGQPVTATVYDARFGVTLPRVSPGSPLCHLVTHRGPHWAAVTFLALRPGDTYVGATTAHLRDGSSRQLYGGRIVVQPR